MRPQNQCYNEVLVYYPGHFSIQIQTGTYLTPAEKTWLPKSDLANFRPISNLNTIGKILERLALTRFSLHFKISQFFSSAVCLSQISFYGDCFA